MAQPNTHTKPINTFEQFLRDREFLTKEQYEQLLSIKNTKYGDSAKRLDYMDLSKLLVAEKLLEEEVVAKAKAAFLNLPYVDLSKETVDEQVMVLIPEESRNFYKMIPYELKGRDLKIALLDPTNIQALEALEFLGQKANYQIHIYVTSSASIEPYLEGKHNIKEVVSDALEDIANKESIDGKAINKTTGKKEEDDEEGDAVKEEAPIIKIVDVILSNAIDANASDIHIEPSENDIRVRYRIDGILHTSLRLPRNVLPAVVSRIKILSNLKIDETRLPQDGRFHAEMKKKSVDLRVSTLPLMLGEKIVMRLLDKSTEVPTLDQLGIRGKALAWVLENIKKTHGVFLITGPTGSGKSTTLYSILSLRNTNEVNIVTLEDPVEYFMEGVNQSQIKPEIGLTFASGLRSILRQDPNIVMVGEIRDEETAGLAVHAALTGHLVFSTLHTNNSVGAIPRLMNMGIEQFLLAASIILIMAQRLVRKLCPDCKKPGEISPIIRKEIESQLVGIPKESLEGLDLNNMQIWQPQGCDNCGNIGYKGRFGIFEVLPMLNELQEPIFSKMPAHKIYEEAAKYGFITMKQDGIIKVLRGETSMEEIARVTTDE